MAHEQYEVCHSEVKSTEFLPRTWLAKKKIIFCHKSEGKKFRNRGEAELRTT